MKPRYPTLESSRARMRVFHMDSANARMRSLSGKLSTRVGSGTYGSVFWAPQEPRDEVMKVLKSKGRLMADDEVKARVRHEVATLITLDSARVKGVAKIIGWTDQLRGHPLGSCAIFMARAGGISLRQLGSEIKSSTRTGAVINRNDILNDVAGQVANTLINMHAEGGVTHNDVNARNIVLEVERDEVGNIVKARATLVDFGCATWNRDDGRSPITLANNSLFLCPESLFAYIDKNSGKNLKFTDGMQDGWKTDSYAMAATFAREFGLKVYRLCGVDENFGDPNPDFLEVAKHLLACDVNQRWTAAQLQESTWYKDWKRSTSFFEPLPSSVEAAKALQAAGPAEGYKGKSKVAAAVRGNTDDGSEKSTTAFCRGGNLDATNDRDMARETASSTCFASGHLAATTRTRESTPPTAAGREYPGREKDGSMESKWSPAEAHSLTVEAKVGAGSFEYPPALDRSTPSNYAEMGDYRGSTVYPDSLSESHKIGPTRGEESGGAPPSLGVDVPTSPTSNSTETGDSESSTVYPDSLSVSHMIKSTRREESGGTPPSLGVGVPTSPTSNSAETGDYRSSTVDTASLSSVSHNIEPTRGEESGGAPPSLGVDVPTSPTSNSTETGDSESSTVYPASLSLSHMIKSTRGEESGGDPPSLGVGVPTSPTSNSAEMGDYRSSTVDPASLSSVSHKIEPTRGEESGGAPPSLGVGVPTSPTALGGSPQRSFLSVQSSTHCCMSYSVPSVGTEAGALGEGIADSDGGQEASGSSRAGDLDTDRERNTTRQTASPARALTADDMAPMAMGRETLPPSANGDDGGSEGSSEQRGAVMGLYRCSLESETVQAVFEELDSDSSMDCSDVKTDPGDLHSDSHRLRSNTDMGIRAGTSVEAAETRLHGVVGAAMGLDKSASATETVVAVCAELEPESGMERSDGDTDHVKEANEAAAVASGGKIDPPHGQGGGGNSSYGGAGGSLCSAKYMPYLSGAAGATMAVAAGNDLVEVGQAASRETGGFLEAPRSSGGALSAVLMARAAKTTVDEAAANAVNPPSALGEDVLSGPFTMGSYLYSSKFAVPKEVATVKCPAGVNLEAPRLARMSASAPVTGATEQAEPKGRIVCCMRSHTAVNQKDENDAAVDGTQGTKKAKFSSQECQVCGTRKRRATSDDGGEEGSYSNDAPRHKKSATMAKVGSAFFRPGVAPRGQRGRGCGGNAQSRVGVCGGRETSASKMGGKATATASTATCRDKNPKKRDRDEDDGNGDGAEGEEECPVTKRSRPSGPPSNISS